VMGDVFQIFQWVPGHITRIDRYDSRDADEEVHLCSVGDAGQISTQTQTFSASKCLSETYR